MKHKYLTQNSLQLMNMFPTYEVIKIALNRWFPPLIMIFVIFIASSMPDLPGPKGGLLWWDFAIKKVAHVTEYGLLFFSVQRALNWGQTFEKKRYIVTYIFLFLYACSDEFHQLFTHGRHGKIDDIVFDLLGGFLVYLKLKGFI